MLKHYKLILGILIAILFVVIVGVELSSYMNSKTLQELEYEYDRRLSEYYTNEVIAKSYLEVLTINNNVQYKAVKDKLYAYLDGRLQKELFNYSDYPLQDTPSISYEIKDIKGTQQGYKYVFKIEYVVTTQGYNREFVTLITIEDEKITEVSIL